MKTLYFDIDGTVLLDDENAVKSELGDGRLEYAIREAGFDQLVCVGNYGAIAHAVKSLAPDYDELGVLFGLCRGAFRNESWLRNNVTLIENPQDRAEYIDYSADWWYVDDLARHYMEKSGRAGIYQSALGSRICEPDPKGNGSDILSWLAETVTCPPPAPETR
jgi:hypothetical protein